jgi:tetratricopeptide (TPR) repeat protein
MTQDELFERYRDTLKRGHVAAAQGRLEEALAAYADAAAIAPDRSTPHTSAGTALLREGHLAEALQRFEVAARLAPGDEAARLGRAQTLAALGRPLEAAGAFDTVADAREAAGDMVGAVDAGARALELAEGRDRRRRLERLTARVAAAGADATADEATLAALERARQALDGMAFALPRPDGIEAVAGDATGAADTDAIGEPVMPEEQKPLPGPFDRILPDAELSELVRAADDAIEAGDTAAAIDRLLDVAAAGRADGRVQAALDACYTGLSLAPDSVDLHLALVALYDECGWTSLAGEKANLLARLVALDDEPVAMRRVAEARAARA